MFTQPYGINLYGDIAGLTIVALVFVLLWQVPRTRWVTMSLIFGASALDSLAVLWPAMQRADLTVMIYHAFWVLVALPVLAQTAIVFRTSRRTATITVGDQTYRIAAGESLMTVDEHGGIWEFWVSDTDERPNNNRG